MSLPESPFDPKLISAAKIIFDHCNKECEEKRRFLVPIWKRAQFYWDDIQDLFWNELTNDWATFDTNGEANEYDSIRDSNKIVNSYRAYGESNIAAATIGNLSIRFFPENADDPADLDKARSFSDKADYVQRVNNITELRRKAFRIRWNQGLVGSYTYYKKDKKQFGQFKKDVIGERKEVRRDYTCTGPECEADFPPDKFKDSAQAALTSGLPIPPCPTCQAPVTAKDTVESVATKAGTKLEDRGCATIELYSPLELKVPHYATKVSDINYVLLETEIHYSTARALFPEFADQIQAGDVAPVESRERTQADNYAELSSRNLVTISRFWCKPEMYNILDVDVAETLTPTELLEKYPNGKFSTFINGNILVDCKDEDMDEHWTFVESPLDTHVYLRSLGNGMIPIQDMENDMVFIIMDTIRHAIGETFYDSRVINANVYEQQMTKPGNMVPIDNKLNKNISEYFFSTKNAMLSEQVDKFSERLRSAGQLVTGAFPSVFGGMFEQGGSKTLGVYEQSRAQALQRISMPASAIDNFLAKTVHKATELFDKNMDGDETTSVTDGGTGYRNVTLRKSVPSASISRVEVVKSEQFPMTWEQQRAFVMEVFEKQIPELNAFLLDTTNVSFMKQIVGIPGLTLQGENDRNKQLHEIQALLAAEPIPQMDPVTQMPVEGGAIVSTEAPDPEVDNHVVHIQTIIAWAVSPEGIRTKLENRVGYDNVIAHLVEHKNLYMEMQAATAPAEDSNTDAAAQGEEQEQMQ